MAELADYLELTAGQAQEQFRALLRRRPVTSGRQVAFLPVEDVSKAGVIGAGGVRPDKPGVSHFPGCDQASLLRTLDLAVDRRMRGARPHCDLGKAELKVWSARWAGAVASAVYPRLEEYSSVCGYFPQGRDALVSAGVG